MADNTWELITNRMKALKDWHKRRDDTKDLLYMKDFKLRDFKDTHDLDNVINVTGNRVASYGVRVIENLSSYKFQTVIEGDVTKREAFAIEEFLNASLDQTNVYLTDTYGLPNLYSFWCRHICNRGVIGARFLSSIEQDEYKVDCVPLDMRWTPYILNKWVAPITFWTKDELEEELEKYERMAKDKKIGEYNKPSLTGDNIEARDYWNTERNELWVEKKLVFNQGHPFGKYPFVIVVAPSGFMFRDKGYIEHEGEDIYFLIAKLEKELNRSLSIEQTIGMDILYPPYMKPQELPPDASPAEKPPLTGETKKVKTGEEWKPLPRGDMNRASMAARQDILRQIEEGAPLQPRTYPQAPSGVAIATEVELLAQLYNSRLTALQMGLAQLFRLKIDELIIITKDHKGELAIGERGKRKEFSVAKLKDPDSYKISCRLMTKNTKLEIVNEARAMALWGRAPLKYILRDILMVEDPDGWERELDLAKAKRLNPILALPEIGLRYLEEAENMEDEIEADLKRHQAKSIAHEYVMAMRLRMQPTLAPGQTQESGVEEEKGNMQGLIPLLGQGGGGGNLPKQPAEVAE